MILDIDTDDLYCTVQRNRHRFRDGNLGFLPHIGNISANLTGFIFCRQVGYDPFTKHGIIVAVPVGRIVYSRACKLTLLLPFHKINAGHITNCVPRRIVGAGRLVDHFRYAGIKNIIERISTGHIPVGKGIILIRFISGNGRQRLSGIAYDTTVFIHRAQIGLLGNR